MPKYKLSWSKPKGPNGEEVFIAPDQSAATKMALNRLYGAGMSHGYYCATEEPDSEC